MEKFNENYESEKLDLQRDQHLMSIRQNGERIDVNDLIKGETYISPNTGNKFIFNRYYVTDKNIFAVDIYGTIYIAQKFRKEK